MGENEAIAWAGDTNMEQDAADWLEISGLLLRELKPHGADMEIFGLGMNAADFSALADRERERVDCALVDMALAAGSDEVKAICAALGADTLIGLFSRWAHYQQRWKSNPELWRPANRNDWWRAILLAMTSENIRSTATARFLWAEQF